MGFRELLGLAPKPTIDPALADQLKKRAAFTLSRPPVNQSVLPPQISRPPVGLDFPVISRPPTVSTTPTTAAPFDLFGKVKAVNAALKPQEPVGKAIKSGAIKKVAEFAAAIPQAIPRYAAGPVLDVVGGATGQVNPQTLASTVEITPNTPFKKLLFGSEPVKSQTQKAVERENIGEKYGGYAGRFAAAPLIGALAGGMDLVPFTPEGAGKKLAGEAAEAVAKSGGKKVAEKVLSKAARIVTPEDIVKVAEEAPGLSHPPQLPVEFRKQLPKFGTQKKEMTAIAGDLEKSKKQYVDSFLQSPEGSQAIEKINVQKELLPEYDNRVLQGIKANAHFKDAMAQGTLMQKGDKYIIATPEEVSGLSAKGYERRIEIDQLAQEAGFDDPHKFLEETLSRSEKANSLDKLPKSARGLATQELRQADPNFTALEQETKKARATALSLPPKSAVDVTKDTEVADLAGDIFKNIDERARVMKGMKTLYPEFSMKGEDLARAVEAERRTPAAPALARPPIFKPPEVLNKNAILREVEKITSASKAEKKGIKDFWSMGKNAVTKLQTQWTSEFTPLGKAEAELTKKAGLSRPPVSLSRKFEQVAGAAGKAEADIIEFRAAVVDPIKNHTDEFNQFVFLRRTIDRLESDPTRKAVGDWTVAKAQAGLDALKAKTGDELFQKLEQVATGPYQEMMDRSLRLQVDAGKMSEEVYQAIKQSNDFYAPFKIIKYINETGGIAGSGRKIATTQELTKAIRGISDDEFQIGDILQTSAQQIYKSRILAEKNRVMLDLAPLADLDGAGTFLKKAKPGVKFGTKPRPGYEVVEFYQNGKKTALEVRKDLAEAINGLNPAQAGLVTKTLMAAASPFRWGVTTANAGFQVVNLLFADLPRLALISKFGVRNIDDVVRFPLDYGYSFFTSLKGNVFGKPNELFMDWLKSGAAHSTMSRQLMESNYKKTLGIPAKTLLGKAGRAVSSVLDTVDGVSNAIEETAKITGLKRGMRFSKIKEMDPVDARRAMEEIVTEVRNYAGSPDFPRKGTSARSLNLLFMFFTARIAGVSSDLARLSGRTGGKEAAATWGKLATAVGLPTLALAMVNQSDENLADYENIPQWERDNYFMIPKADSHGDAVYFENEDGERVRDYWQLPKRETVKLIANLVESSVAFARTKDPEGLKKYAMSFLENISPFGIEGQNLRERGESIASSMNPAIKAPLEYATGRDFFRHRNVVPMNLENVAPPEQYTNATPEIYKKFGKAVGASPLRVRQLVQGFTGSGVEQFIPQPAVKGRSALSLAPVIRRFVRSPYTNKEDFWNEYNTAKTSQETNRLLLKREAEKKWSELKSMDPKIADQKLFKIYNENKDLYKKIREIGEDDKAGIGSQERSMKTLGIENGERAQFVLSYLNTNFKTPTEKDKELEKLWNQKIVTKDVLKQMGELINKGSTRLAEAR